MFVDGCFWHGCETHGTWPAVNREYWRAKISGNVLRDRRVDDLLAQALALSIEKDLFDTLGMFRAEETLEENLKRLDENQTRAENKANRTGKPVENPVPFTKPATSPGAMWRSSETSPTRAWSAPISSRWAASVPG